VTESQLCFLLTSLLVDKNIHFIFIQGEFLMPRLVGRRQNIGALVLPMFIIVAAAAGTLQYYTVVDFPNLVQQVKMRLSE
jgi:hypothetical protein